MRNLLCISSALLLMSACNTELQVNLSGEAIPYGVPGTSNVALIDEANFVFKAQPVTTCDPMDGQLVPAEGMLNIDPLDSVINNVSIEINSFACADIGLLLDGSADSIVFEEIDALVETGSSWLGIDTLSGQEYNILNFTFKSVDQILAEGYDGSYDITALNDLSEKSMLIVFNGIIIGTGASATYLLEAETFAGKSLEDIIKDIRNEISDLPISEKEADKLLSRVNKIVKAIDSDTIDFQTALDLSQSLVNQINRLEKQGKITSIEADLIREIIFDLIDRLNESM